jgi:regulator of RNase E activity RraA
MLRRAGMAGLRGLRVVRVVAKGQAQGESGRLARRPEFAPAQGQGFSRGGLAVADAALLAKLASYDTPTICNALEIVDPARRLTGFTVKPLVCPFPQLSPVVGYAKTATIRAAHAHELDAKAAREQRLAYYEYVASKPAPGIAIIQDLDSHDSGFGAFWGEVQSAVHKGLGLVGVVTDGSIRDIDQWAPGFQALAGSIAPSHAHVHLADFGKQVRVAGMLVRSGDLVHADRHGAVTIPHDKADRIAAACDLLARKEAVILEMARAPGFNIAKLREALAKQDEIH